jgi:hypothetical protein
MVLIQLDYILIMCVYKSQESPPKSRDQLEKKWRKRTHCSLSMCTVPPTRLVLWCTRPAAVVGLFTKSELAGLGFFWLKITRSAIVSVMCTEPSTGPLQDLVRGAPDLLQDYTGAPTASHFREGKCQSDPRLGAYRPGPVVHRTGPVRP